ncbi:MAG: hypothetical protein LBV04_07595 [Deferribacteraceae bacterium]|jgi:soluble lytic murein transglycosylase-like protein|nr:hypothetical protein [Deferribacteraceae bacterium]
MRRVYLYSLLAFAALVLLVNVITFFTSFDGRQLVNLYNMSERIQAIGLLAKHVVFESGLILKEAAVEDINQIINDAAVEYHIEPRFAFAMLADIGQKAYAIDTNGAMGYMRISTDILANYPDKDPFSAKDNMDMGIAHLASLIASTGSYEEAMQQYSH